MYDQKKQAGRGPMMKTGRNIPDTFKGPMAAQDGPIDDIIEGAKNVAKTISTAHTAGMEAYNKSKKPSNSWGSSRRGGTYVKNPAKYVTGAIGSLMD